MVGAGLGGGFASSCHGTLQSGHEQPVAHMAMVQNQWYHFGIGAPPILVYFGGDWGVHWQYEVLTLGHMAQRFLTRSVLRAAE